MRAAAGPHLAAAVSEAGGLGFLGSGTDLTTLKEDLKTASKLLSASPSAAVASYESNTGLLPIGVGVICHLADINLLVDALKGPHIPCAVWLFAAEHTHDLKTWKDAVRKTAVKLPRVWVQVGSVREAIEVVDTCQPNVLVVQGIDAGGHGLEKGAGIISLLPEVADVLETRKHQGMIQGDLPTLIATGGIVNGRGVAAALALGAKGVCMGTRYLASEETVISDGYKNEVLRAHDGGQTTARSKVYDTLRGTTHWPERYGGRGVLNQSFHDWSQGMSLDENKRRYDEALKLGDSGWGPSGRMTTYAGTAVGLVKQSMKAGDITEEVRTEAQTILRQLAQSA